MVFLVLAGLAAATNLVQEILPELSLDQVQILVEYPGATPGEIEESVVRKIEEQIRGVEGLDRLVATASEGFGSVVAEFKSGIDIDRAINEVKAEVDRIITFPEEAQRPQGARDHESAERHPPAGSRRCPGARPQGIGVRHRGGNLVPPGGVAGGSQRCPPIRGFHRSTGEPAAGPGPHARGCRPCGAAGFDGAVGRTDLGRRGGDPRPHPGPELRPGRFRGHHRPDPCGRDIGPPERDRDRARRIRRNRSRFALQRPASGWRRCIPGLEREGSRNSGGRQGASGKRSSARSSTGCGRRNLEGRLGRGLGKARPDDRERAVGAGARAPGAHPVPRGFGWRCGWPWVWRSRSSGPSCSWDSWASRSTCSR